MTASERVMITGASGFIGSHIVQFFLKKRISVIAVDHREPGYNVPGTGGFKFLKTNLNRTTGTELIIRKYKPVCIIHHASNLVDVELSIRYPGKAFADIQMTVCLANLGRKYGMKHFIYASSANVYGSPETEPITENFSVDPMSPYGITKASVESFLTLFSVTYRIPCTIFRYFNVYGPHQTLHTRAAIPSFVTGILKGRRIEVRGGDQTRDFVYVGDVARANYLAFRKKAGGIINIGGGKPISINSLVALIAGMTGIKPDVNYIPRGSTDSVRSWADIKKAGKLLGWKPQVSIERGMKKTIAYFRELA